MALLAPGPQKKTFWAVPSLTNLLSIQMDPQVEDPYAQGQWAIRHLVVSLREPDQFIELVKPAGQGEISTRGADLAGDENLHAPLAPEENADELCIAYLCKALEALRRLADRRAIPKAQVPHVDFSTFPPSHVCKEVDDYNRLIAAAQSVGQLRTSELHRSSTGRWDVSSPARR
jgi:hypothetical protein